MGKKRLIVNDVSLQSKGVGKIGPLLPSFAHAPCNPHMLLAGIDQSHDYIDQSLDYSDQSHGYIDQSHDYIDQSHD